MRQLRVRITLLASLLTGMVVTAVLLFAFLVSRQQYITSRQEAFSTSLAQLQYQWERFDQLADSWLAELEGRSQLQVELLENGQPLLYSLRASLERNALFQRVKEKAALEYGLDVTAPPLLPSGESADFILEEGGRTYRCAVRLEGSPGERWTALLAVQDLLPQQEYLSKLALLFGLITAAGWVVLTLVSWVVAGRAVAPVARAMEEQQQFLSAAGHELRTPWQ